MVKKNRLLILLRFFVSFGLLAFLFWIIRDDLSSIIRILAQSDKAYLGAAMCIILPLSTGMGFRLKLLLDGQGIRLPLKDLVYLAFIGYFFNNFFPTAIGGDIVKAHYTSKKTNNRAASYAAIVVDRIIGSLSCVSLAVVGILFIGGELNNKKVVWTVISILVVLSAVGMLLLKKKGSVKILDALPGDKPLVGKAKEKIRSLYKAINTYSHNRIPIIKSYVLSVFMHACTVIAVYFFILSLGGNIKIIKLFLVIPLVWTISMLPSLNGLGVREGAFVYFLKQDLGTEMAFAISFLWLGVIILYSVIGGILHLLFPVQKVVSQEVKKTIPEI